MARKSENTGNDRAKQSANRGFGFAQAPAQGEAGSAASTGGLSQEGVAEAAAVGAAVAEAGTLGAAAAILGAAEEDTRFASALARTIAPRLETISTNLSTMSRSLEGIRGDSKRSTDNYARVEICKVRDRNGNPLGHVHVVGERVAELIAYNGETVPTKNESKLRNVFVTNIDRAAYCCVPMMARYLPLSVGFDYFDVKMDALVDGVLNCECEDKAMNAFVESSDRLRRAVEKRRAARCPAPLDIKPRELVQEFVGFLKTVFEVDDLFRKLEVDFDRRLEHLQPGVRNVYADASARQFVEKFYGDYIEPFSMLNQPVMAPRGQAEHQCPVSSYVPRTEDEVFFLDCDDCCCSNEIDYRPAELPQALLTHPLETFIDLLGECRENVEPLEEYRALCEASTGAAGSTSGQITMALSYNLPAGITFDERPMPLIRVVGADGKITTISSPASSDGEFLVYKLSANLDYVEVRHRPMSGVDAQGDPVIGVAEQNVQLFSRADSQSGYLNAGSTQVNPFAVYKMETGGRPQVVGPTGDIIDNGATFLSRLPAIPLLTVSNGA